jgi:hypothetical protein
VVKVRDLQFGLLSFALTSRIDKTGTSARKERMSTQEWALAAVFSVPALALVVWASLVRREMKEEQERKKIH